MGPEVLVHADDFGLSDGINDSIVRAIEHGPVNSVSFMPNGWSAEPAARYLRDHPEIRFFLHFNLFEGPSLSPAEKIPDLVDRRGVFHRGFLYFLCRSFLPGQGDLRRQIRTEFLAQWERATALVGRTPEGIDSHLHYHLNPVIFDALQELRPPHVRVRLPFEPLTPQGLIRALRAHPVNLAKLAVTRLLARRNGSKHRLRAQLFYGILHTLKPDSESVQDFCERACRRELDRDVMLLFHPGQCRPDEAKLWPAPLARVYGADARQHEFDLLTSPPIRNSMRRLAEHARRFHH